MRATRAYLAGFGTSGSLLAGAALMFVLASAIIAFRGWPQVANPASPVSVSIPKVNARAGSRASRVLLAAGAAHGLRALRAAGAFGSLRGTRLAGGAGGVVFGAGNVLVAGHNSLGTPTAHDVSSSGSPQHCTSGCTKPGGPVSTAVSQAVSTAQNTASSTVSTAKKTVKKILPHGLGSAGSGATSTVSGAVSGATQGAGSSLP